MRLTQFTHLRTNFARASFAAFALVISLLASACSGAKSRGEEQRYDLKGKVISVDKAKGEATIDHEPIPGFMDAMVMDFKFKDKDVLNVLEAGDRIQATLVIADEGAWLENPMVTKGTPDGSQPATNEAGPKAGDEVPDASLINQDEKPVRLKQYRGRALLLTFIYTRCPLADYCPLISQRFASLARDIKADAALRDKVHLLSVSIDPQHDTPKVLRSYGGAYTENYGDEKFEMWEFATGDPEEIKRLAGFFGMDYFADKDQIVHTLRTAVIDPRGRIHKVFRGNDWQLSEVLDEARKAAAMSAESGGAKEKGSHHN